MFWLLPALLARLLAGNGLLDLSAGLFSTWAISLGPVSLINAVEGVQPLYVLGIAALFRIREPHLARERRAVRWVRTTFAVVCTAAGLVLLQYAD